MRAEVFEYDPYATRPSEDCLDLLKLPDFTSLEIPYGSTYRTQLLLLNRSMLHSELLAVRDPLHQQNAAQLPSLPTMIFRHSFVLGGGGLSVPHWVRKSDHALMLGQNF